MPKAESTAFDYCPSQFTASLSTSAVAVWAHPSIIEFPVFVFKDPLYASNTLAALVCDLFT
jgi:hypothetical protein